MASPIAKLGPEILLEIFEWLSQSQNGDATLFSCVLCCKKWGPLVSSVLYGDVVLTPKRLAKFAENCADHQIRSLTVRLGAIPVNPYDPSEAKQTAESRLEALRQLCLQIEKVRPTALSISVDFPFPFTASQEISSILNHLPRCCVSLEIDVRYGSIISNFTADLQAHLHLCDSIRAVLPQLQNLRLRLPVICPGIFSAGLPDQKAPCRAIRAPTLKTCLINLSLRPPGPYPNQGPWATSCSDDATRVPYVGQLDRLPSALPPILPALKEFALLNSTNLQRLWAIDVEPRDSIRPHSWAAWVRRDFISNTSLPIPVANIGGFGSSAWLARVPPPMGADNTQDWLSSPDVLETLAEGSTWVETSFGTRLPATMLREHQKAREALARAAFQKRNGISCMLWRNEEETGEKLLSGGPGELMKQWDLNETTPNGWTRDEHTASPMVRA
ncbi:hypothetical protein F4821DRAFT_187975 [Hypoxylon rubiginosum]|uniref:Uncharacterized protein n=1 Tax=Hypoxylon rubiginosum TaxID=110542 RepID=A0ACC0DGP6_9PEZI|nr:hypothetical protein F4821DRAFT_187975 [Hypoxylon rubiginosum]